MARVWRRKLENKRTVGSLPRVQTNTKCLSQKTFHEISHNLIALVCIEIHTLEHYWNQWSLCLAISRTEELGVMGERMEVSPTSPALIPARPGCTQSCASLSNIRVYLHGCKMEFSKIIQPLTKQIKQRKIASPGGRGWVLRIAILSKKYNVRWQKKGMPRNRKVGPVHRGKKAESRNYQLIVKG